VNNPDVHNYFNKNLPIEIIETIVSYLDHKSLLILAISRLFAPALFTLPSFFENINTYFLHSLCGHFTTNRNLISYFTPFIHYNQFYFAFATYIIDQDMKKFKKTDLRPFTDQFTTIFEKSSKSSEIYTMPDCLYSTVKCEPCTYYNYSCGFSWAFETILFCKFRRCTCHWYKNLPRSIHQYRFCFKDMYSCIDETSK
jgi:hypothetical protein